MTSSPLCSCSSRSFGRFGGSSQESFTFDLFTESIFPSLCIFTSIALRIRSNNGEAIALRLEAIAIGLEQQVVALESLECAAEEGAVVAAVDVSVAVAVVVIQVHCILDGRR